MAGSLTLALIITTLHSRQLLLLSPGDGLAFPGAGPFSQVNLISISSTSILYLVVVDEVSTLIGCIHYKYRRMLSGCPTAMGGEGSRRRGGEA